LTAKRKKEGKLSFEDGVELTDGLLLHLNCAKRILDDRRCPPHGAAKRSFSFHTGPALSFSSKL
jgi:hypothetical protein